MTKTITELFNEAVAGVIAQGEPAVDSVGLCMYRYGALKCAVGMIIPDEKYVEEMEDTLVNDILKAIGIPEESHLPFNKLQSAHDEADRNDFVADFTHRAKAVAKEFRITLS